MRLAPPSVLAIAAIGLALAPGPAAARPNTLTPEQISAFQSKVAQARATQKTVGDREVCLRSYVDTLRGRGDERERALGESRRREEDLGSSLARLEDEQRQYASTFADEQRAFDDKDRDLQSAMAEQREQDRRLHECRQALTIISFMCDIGDDAVKKLGWMRDVQSEMSGIQARLSQAQNALQDAQRRLSDSQNALTQTRDQVSFNQSSIREIEGEIVRVKSTIADLHATIQTYNILIADFASMLDEANDVDVDSPRARQISRLSSEVDDLTSRAPAALDLAKSALPEGMRQSCPQP